LAEAHQQPDGRPLPAEAGVYAMLASILCKWGETGPSLQAARKGLALSELWGQADTTMLCLLHLAEGLALARDFEAARQTVQRARKIAQGVSPWFVLNVDEVEIRIWLDADDTVQAARIAQEASMELPTSLRARLLLKQNRLDEALAVMERTLPEALETPSLESVRLDVLQALAHYLKKDEARALTALRRALEQAELENRVEDFVREGQVMEKLLQRAQAKAITPKFTRQLLEAFQERREPGVAPLGELFVEALSGRELEVLHLLNSHLSVPEIAGELYVSANTVRTHIKNIYGKLGVHRRSMAVHRARELGLLA
jgi:LuxR family maltose regulon positive regulatory protein